MLAWDIVNDVAHYCPPKPATGGTDGKRVPPAPAVQRFGSLQQYINHFRWVRVCDSATCMAIKSRVVSDSGSMASQMRDARSQVVSSVAAAKVACSRHLFGNVAAHRQQLDSQRTSVSIPSSGADLFR